MIEDVLLFALGFLVAILLALACLPAVWHRALRLTRRRLEMLVPLSPAEVAGERDGLRAQAAVAQRRLEQRLEASERRAADMAARYGRQTAELVALGEARDEAQAQTRSLLADLSGTEARLVDAESQAAALQMQFGQQDLQLDQLEAERRDAKLRIATLEVQLEEDRGALAALDTKVAGLSVHLKDVENEREQLRAERDDLVVKRATAMEERDSARRQVTFETERREMVEQQLREEVGRTADRSVRMQAKSEALARAQRQIMEQTAEMRASSAALGALKQRFEDLQAKLIARVVTPGGVGGLSEQELLELRKDVISAADDALLLLHNPMSNDAIVLKSPVPQSSPAPTGSAMNGQSGPNAEAVL